MLWRAPARSSSVLGKERIKGGVHLTMSSTKALSRELSRALSRSRAASLGPTRRSAGMMGRDKPWRGVVFAQGIAPSLTCRTKSAETQSRFLQPCDCVRRHTASPEQQPSVEPRRKHLCALSRGLAAGGQQHGPDASTAAGAASGRAGHVRGIVGIRARTGRRAAGPCLRQAGGHASHGSVLQQRHHHVPRQRAREVAAVCTGWERRAVLGA